jgi:hypothetical protein
MMEVTRQPVAAEGIRLPGNSETETGPVFSAR